ncbi:MAG TPA: tetratricopeptide repeat protein, partial [bacterium]|nr:tetratricopeptide repeat protein [bacterium]
MKRRGSVLKFYAIAVLPCAVLLSCARAMSGEARQAVFISVVKNLGVTISLPDGWNKAAEGDCVISPRGKNYCMDSAKPAGLPPCARVELEARFKDDPEDKLMSLDFLPAADGRLENRGLTGACAARVTAPKINSVVFRAAYTSELLSVNLFSERFAVGRDVRPDEIAVVEQESKRLFDSLSVSALMADQPPPRPKQDPERPDFERVKKEGAAYQPRVRPEPLLKADGLKLTGKYDEAALEYATLSVQFPYDSEIGLGDIEIARGNYEAARSRYQNAMNADPSRPDALNGLGSVAFALGKVDEAEEFFKRAELIDPENPGTLVNMGWVNVARGRWIDAEKSFMGALARSPDPDVAASATNGLT